MIDILNFRKYFRREGDNGLAKIGHVNSVLPLVRDNDPITLELIPEFPGQIVIDTLNTKVWIAKNYSEWTFLTLN
jgi:hypothetical protein